MVLLNVQTVDGLHNWSWECDENAPCRSIKDRVNGEMPDAHPDSMKLLFCGTILDDNTSILSTGVEAQSTIFVLVAQTSAPVDNPLQSTGEAPPPSYDNLHTTVAVDNVDPFGDANEDPFGDADVSFGNSNEDPFGDANEDPFAEEPTEKRASESVSKLGVTMGGGGMQGFGSDDVRGSWRARPMKSMKSLASLHRPENSCVPDDCDVGPAAKPVAAVLLYILIAGFFLGSCWTAIEVFKSADRGAAAGVCVAWMVGYWCFAGGVFLCFKDKGADTCFALMLVICVVQIIVIWTVGMAGGGHFKQVQQIEERGVVRDVAVYHPPVAGAGLIEFIEGATRVDTGRGGYITVRQGKSTVTYCVAPLRDASPDRSSREYNATFTDGKQTVISYWAFSKGCCAGGNWNCEGYSKQDWHTGIIPYESSAVASYHSTLRNAAKGQYGMTDAPGAIWIKWAKNEASVIKTEQDWGWGLLLGFSLGWPVLLCLVACVFGAATCSKRR